MTIDEFEKLDELFNSLIERHKTLEVWNCVDDDTFYNRCLITCDEKIEPKLVFLLGIYNRLIEEEKYKEAFQVRNFIISGEELKIEIVDERID